MKKYLLCVSVTFLLAQMPLRSFAQIPCSQPEFRQFDFWIGDWEAYNKAGKKSGDSKISLILDSCIILEEWTSTGVFKGLTYAGKSFNKYNPQTKQWQQTWVDNTGASTEYLKGKYENKKIIFETEPFNFSKDTIAIMKLTFFDLDPNKVRQLGEITKDNGKTWVTQYDLEYRRKIKN
jgi:hypothetical protein